MIIKFDSNTVFILLGMSFFLTVIISDILRTIRYKFTMKKLTSLSSENRKELIRSIVEASDEVKHAKEILKTNDILMDSLESVSDYNNDK